MSLKYPKWQFNFWSPNHKNTNIHNFKDNVSSQYLIQIKRYIGVGQVASPNSVYSGGGGGGAMEKGGVQEKKTAFVIIRGCRSWAGCSQPR